MRTTLTGWCCKTYLPLPNEQLNTLSHDKVASIIPQSTALTQRIMYHLFRLALLHLALANNAGASPQGQPQHNFTTANIPPQAEALPFEHGSHHIARAEQQKGTFNFDVRSDQIVLMMDGLADISARIAETRDPEFYKKEEDDAPPFKCHCKCSLLGGCECWCGDQDKKPGDRS